MTERGLYRHWKGGIYWVEGPAESHANGADRGATFVAYQSTRSARDGVARLRPSAEFADWIYVDDGSTYPGTPPAGLVLDAPDAPDGGAWVPDPVTAAPRRIVPRFERLPDDAVLQRWSPAGRAVDRATLEACARAVHEVNQVYCARVGDAPSPAWDALTEAQRAGVVAGVAHALAGGSAAASHELWLATRRAEGWTFGEVKDFARRTSPNMVPYAALPEQQRRKDDLLQAVARALAAALADPPPPPRAGGAK